MIPGVRVWVKCVNVKEMGLSLSKTKLRSLVLLAILVGLGVWLSSDRQSEEDQIRAAIHAVAEGAEDADIGSVMEPFSDQYQDVEGLNRSGIYGILWQQFNRRGPISVWLSPIDVQVDGATAAARFEVGLVEGNSQTLIAWPIDAEALHFEVDLAREDGVWKIVGHRRSSVTGSGDTG